MGSEKWDFLLIFSTFHADVGGWVQKRPKTYLRNTWMVRNSWLCVTFWPFYLWLNLLYCEKNLIFTSALTASKLQAEGVFRYVYLLNKYYLSHIAKNLKGDAKKEIN